MGTDFLFILFFLVDLMDTFCVWMQNKGFRVKQGLKIISVVKKVIQKI